MMNFFRRRQDNRRKKPRPEGRVANLWHGIVSLVFYCILNDAAGGDHDQEVVREPPAGTISSSNVEPFTTDILADHRKSNHEPNSCLPSLSSSIAHSPSVGRSQEGKGDRKPNTASEKKRNWFSWFKKGSNKNKVTEQLVTKVKDESAAAMSVKPEQGLSESSFKILQLTASPGGARKAYTNRLCSRPVHKTNEVNRQVSPRLASANDVHVEKKSVAGGKHHDAMETFSLSDVSSFGASETSDKTCSSFTEVTSLSSGELSDCWGLSDGQLPPSISSTSTDSFTDDGEDHVQGSTTTTPAAEGTMSDGSDGSESDDTRVETRGMKIMDIPAACCSGNSAATEDIAAQTDAPNTAVDQEASFSSDSVVIPGDIDTSTSTDIPVSTDAPNTVDTSDSTDRVGEVPGGTIADVYALIVRTLNLGVPKSTDAVPRDTCSTRDDNKAAKTHHRPSTTAAALTGNEENTSEVPEYKTPSLHKLHTEWPKHHVNIEVLLGLKAPKNSFDALVVQQCTEQEASYSSNNTSKHTGTMSMSTPTEEHHLSGSIEAESEMTVDSGIGSHGDCKLSEP